MAYNRKEYNQKYRLKNKARLTIKFKEWVEANKEHYKQYQKEYQKIWYQKNKEEHDRKGKIWGLNPENKKKRVKYVQKYVQNNKEKVKAYGIEFNKTIKGRYRTTKGNAYAKGHDFNLSFEEYAEIISKPCVYCGESQKVGIDRIDNSFGYTKENAAPCCSMCNYMKRHYSKKDFLSHIEKIYLFKNK